MFKVTMGPRRFALLLFVAGLFVRFIAFAAHPAPAYPDAIYYATVAREIAAGHGFVVPYLWSFVELAGRVPTMGSLPVPAFGHWMPAASLIQVPFIFIFGPTDLASALPFLLVGAMVAPLVYLIFRDLLPVDWPGREWVTHITGLLLVIPGLTAGYLSQPDNFALFALLVNGALWATARAKQKPNGLRFAALAGILSGAACLSRADGPLLVGLIALFLTRHPRQAFVAIVTAILLLIPWWVRQLIVFGSLSPSAAGGRILWIREYNEMFAADGPLGPDHLLNWGLLQLGASRMDAAGQVGLLTGIGLLGGLLVPFALFGIWRLCRVASLRPFFAWCGLVLIWSILVAAPHVGSGNFLHIGFSLMPFLLLASSVGLYDSWPRLSKNRSRTMAAVASLFLSFCLTSAGIIYSAGLFTSADKDVALAVAWLNIHAAPDSIILSPNPGALWQHGWRGVPTPASDLTVLKQVARAYNASYLVLFANQTPPQLDNLLDDPGPNWFEGRRVLRISDGTNKARLDIYELR